MISRIGLDRAGLEMKLMINCPSKSYMEYIRAVLASHLHRHARMMNDGANSKERMDGMMKRRGERVKRRIYRAN